MKQMTGAALVVVGAALSTIYILKPGEPLLWTPLPALTGLLAGLPLAGLGVFGLLAGPRVKRAVETFACWFCKGTVGPAEFDHGIAQWFQGPRDHIQYPAHNSCADNFVVGYARSNRWPMVQRLHPDLLGSNGFAPPPPPAPKPAEGPATPGPSPAAPVPPPATAGLTKEEEAVLRVVRSSSVPLNLTQTLIQSGLPKSKLYVLYGLQHRGLLLIESQGKWPAPTLVKPAPEGAR